MKLPNTYYYPQTYWAHMITFRCNGGCPYCVVDGRGLAQAHKYKELSGKEITKIWNSIENHTGRKLSIIGGEPTLHKDFVEIIHELPEYKVTVTTNVATKFFNQPSYWKELKLSNLRINTTYHPSSKLEPELYVERIKEMRSNGVWVDFTGMVNHPELDKAKYEQIFKKLGLNMLFTSFLGFWDKTGGFANNICEETLWPNHNSDPNRIRIENGIDNIEQYIAQCGASSDTKKQWDCPHGMICFLVAPDGTVHECHYKLYYNVEPRGNILGDWTPVTEAHTCNSFGKCNWCDSARLGIASNLFCKKLEL